MSKQQQNPMLSGQQNHPPLERRNAMKNQKLWISSMKSYKLSPFAYDEERAKRPRIGVPGGELYPYDGQVR